jgi:ArsR family transcriptional regulator
MKTLGHPVRLEIVKYLRGGERSVGEIQHHLGLIQAVTSQHLRKLYKEGVVTFRREKTSYYYSIANEFIQKLLTCFTECEAKIQSGEWKLKDFGFE